MPPQLALLNADVVTAVGLRPLKYFLVLRDRRRREELVREEQMVPGPAD